MEGLDLEGATINNKYPEGAISRQTMSVTKWSGQCKVQEINI